MSQKILHIFRSEGFIAEAYLKDGCVTLVADADIDADGANGQHGQRPAYMVGDKGSEALANGGMGIRGGRVVCVQSWARDIVVVDLSDGQPLVFPAGVIASKTAYRYPEFAPRNPAAYVDSETVPYIVVSPILINAVPGVVLGCQARCTNLRTGKVVNGVVADVGPRNKIGEVSIAMARGLGLPDSPRHGGEDDPIVRYEFWPGVAAEVAGKTFRLQRANGTYV